MNTQRNLISAISLCAAIAVPNIASAASISGQGTWETTLQARDLTGNGIADAYYDTVLNITWLADVNAGAGSAYDTASPGTGLMNWFTANAWAAGLDVYGITGWRLPTVSPIDGTTADDATYSYIGTEDRGHNVSAPGTLYAGSTASEMAHLFYNTLGNKSSCNPTTSTVSNCVSQSGYGLTNTGPFSNLNITLYWSAAEYAPDTDWAWVLNTEFGEQLHFYKTNIAYAWAAHDGDVGVAIPSAVPIPAAAWLFASGLLGLIGIARKKAA